MHFQCRGIVSLTAVLTLVSTLLSPAFANAAVSEAPFSTAAKALTTSQASTQRTDVKSVNAKLVTAKKGKSKKAKKGKRKLVVTGNLTSTGVKAQGSKVTVKGSINHSRKSGYVVKLQRWNYGWRTVASKRVKGKSFTFSNIKIWPRDTWLQLVTPAQGKYRGDDSRNMLVRVSRCNASTAPSGQVSTWFTLASSPRTYAPSAITSAYVNAICSAGNNATMRIAMYYAIFGAQKKNNPTAGSIETDYLLRALTFVKQVRKVKISMLLEGKQYPKNAKEANQKRLENNYGIRWNQVVASKKILSGLTNGRVWYCQTGCRNTQNDSPGNMHSKYMTISNTVWKAGDDQLVLNGSANFSAQQLRYTVNDLTQIYNNKQIYTAFANDFDVNKACYAATKSNGNCARDNGIYSVKCEWYQYGGTTTYPCNQSKPAGSGWYKRWPNTLGVANDNARVFDEDGYVRAFPGDPGKGIRVSFSPMPTYKQGDYVTNQLAQLRCAPGRRTVKMLIPALGTLSRTSYFNTQLERLAQTGCNIKFVMDGKPGKKAPKTKADNKTPSNAQELAALKPILNKYKANIQVRCQRGQHSKSYVFRTERQLGVPNATSQPWKPFDAVLAGSPNLTSGLRYGTESAELMAVQDATLPGYAANIMNAVDRYERHFDDVWNSKDTGRCYWTY